MKTTTDLDTPAGRQAGWRTEHRAKGDLGLTAEDVLEHIDARLLAGRTPERYIADERWMSERFGGFDVTDVRALSPLEAVVTLTYADGVEFSWTCQVGEEPPYRIVQETFATADLGMPEEAGPEHPVVHCVDHFFVALPEPAPALELMTETLGLPLSWPFIPADAEGHGNGAVELGNAQLEFLNFAMYDAFVPRTPARVQGIAFEPPPLTDDFIGELGRRGLPHAPPMPWGVFTNVFFGGVIKDPTAVVFLCRYHAAAVRDRVARGAALDAVDGGELRVTGVIELVIGTTRWQKSVDRWQNLVNPIQPDAPGHWKIGPGPAIRIVDADDDAVREVVLGVRSVEHAIARVRDLSAGTTAATDDGLLLDLPALNGLAIRLTESNRPS